MDIDELRRRTRRGLVTATGHLTATEGSLRVALDELAERGVGARIIKGALAATLAWAVAGQITPGSLPFVASLTALFTVQLTIKQSITGGRQRLLGVLVGISVAFGVSELVGLHSWSMGVVVLVALLVGLRLRLESGGVEQVAATAIVVMFVQSTTDQRAVYAASHLADTAIGTGIGLLLNALVAPPDYVPAARTAVQALGRRLVIVLEDLAAALAEGATAAEATDLLAAVQVVEHELDDVDAALEQAEESLEYNPIGARQRAAFARCRELSEELRAVVYRTLGLTGTLAGASSAGGAERSVHLGPLASPAAEALSAVGIAVLVRIDQLGSELDVPAAEAIGAEVADRAEALREAIAVHLAGLSPEEALRLVPIAAGVLALSSEEAADAPTSDDISGDSTASRSLERTEAR